MEIRKLSPDEVAAFSSLVAIFQTVFEHPPTIPDQAQLGRLLSNPDFMVFVLRQNNAVIGGATIYVLHHYADPRPLAYIYDVGISPEHQGQGHGQALMAAVGQYCRDHGFSAAYVEAESDDLAAVNFYRKTNFTSEMAAIHFTYTFDKKI